MSTPDCDCYDKYLNDIKEQKKVAKNNRWKFYAKEMDLWRTRNRHPNPIPEAYWCDTCIAPQLEKEYVRQMEQDKVRNIFLRRLHENDAEANEIIRCRRNNEIVYVGRQEFPTLFDEVFEITPQNPTGSYEQDDRGLFNEYLVSDILSNTADVILSSE